MSVSKIQRIPDVQLFPGVHLFPGECLASTLFIPDNSQDSVVTDPPYGIKMMGHRWDYDVPSVEIWQECLRVLKPGSYLLAFAGPRTHHRMCCRIEDAGFEIHDAIAWVSAQGMPKHRSKLKPAIELITLARKPAKLATPLNIDLCRVPPDGADDDAAYRAKCESVVGLDSNRNGNCYADWSAPRTDSYSTEGRYPSNLIHDGSPEVVALFPDSKGSGGSVPNVKITGYGGGAVGTGESKYLGGERTKVDCGSGSAARFFARAPFTTEELQATALIYCKKASKQDRGSGNEHPTVKPRSLMRYLIRLVTPPGGSVFDPFTGSGTTGVEAVANGFEFAGAEREPEYVEIARRRITDAWEAAHV